MNGTNGDDDYARIATIELVRLRLIECAAVEYVHAFAALTRGNTDTLLRYDGALHDLVGVLGVECPLCDEGSCPNIVDTDPL